jgi:hypothetical protein
MASVKEKAITLLSTTAIADLSSVAATTLYTVPVGKKCVLTEAWLECAGDTAHRHGQRGVRVRCLGT